LNFALQKIQIQMQKNIIWQRAAVFRLHFDNHLFAVKNFAFFPD
jgi:hypothetical protein